MDNEKKKLVESRIAYHNNQIKQILAGKAQGSIVDNAAVIFKLAVCLERNED